MGDISLAEVQTAGVEIAPLFSMSEFPSGLADTFVGGAVPLSLRKSENLNIH